MTAPEASSPQAVRAVRIRLDLQIGGDRLTAEAAVPDRPMQMLELLPLARHLEDGLVRMAAHRAAAEGRAVSCRAGCGACCRQFVPVSPTEAIAVARLVEALPEPRRSEVRRRFADAAERLVSAGLVPAERSHRDPAEIAGLTREAYWRLQIACPFLEDESCSIHADRPVECRNYQVSSPPERCRDPFAYPVVGECPPTSMTVALLRTGLRLNPAHRMTVPLVLALEWAAAHPQADGGTLPATELVAVLMEALERPPGATRPGEPTETQVG
jgi:Fe-S-cluster containining protein